MVIWYNMCVKSKGDDLDAELGKVLLRWDFCGDIVSAIHRHCL